jgi:hypothetical protein
MKIINAWLSQPAGNGDKTLMVEGEYGVYELNGEQVERALIESNQLCIHCLGSGEVDIYEAVYPGGPHVARIGAGKCICKVN